MESSLFCPSWVKDKEMIKQRELNTPRGGKGEPGKPQSVGKGRDERGKGQQYG